MKTKENFLSKCTKRLEVGAVEYGDKSFYKDSRELINDIDEELMDIANWSAILATTCETNEALAFLQSLVRTSAELSAKLHRAADANFFEDRSLRPGINASGMVALANNFLDQALDE